MFMDLSYGYQTDESPFIDYFKRLKSIGMTRNEIELKLPQLLAYYEDMVKWDCDWDTLRYKNKEEKFDSVNTVVRMGDDGQMQVMLESIPEIPTELQQIIDDHK